jgi:hypothetical protein
VEKENHRKMIRDFVERKNSGALASKDSTNTGANVQQEYDTRKWTIYER